MKTLLVANRGEIARRIFRTAKKLGLKTVAIYTDADSASPHVHEADTAVSIGEPLNYLSVSRIIEAIKVSGADAVHPGYGFLSENPAFVEALDGAKITFLGPTSASMRALGNKESAKALCFKTDVPTSPTLSLINLSPKEITEKISVFGSEHTFPLLLKAASGGGGRGMRLVNQESDFYGAYESASREALKAFGDGGVFIEKYIPEARHIEVQLLGDGIGGVVALGTRDCTLQRNNQKIIEEAPASHIPQSIINAICEAAVKLATSVSYRSLGTAEFLLTPDGSFYFLEVNTRLQVEHPVTECVTGLDLVEIQVKIAEGMTLAQLGLQKSPQIMGHAIESRLCAEALLNGTAIVSPGTVNQLHKPTESVARFDCGYEVGSEVTHHYDSLFGKVITHAETRAEAIRKNIVALEQVAVSGVTTNRALLLHLLRHKKFENFEHTVQGTKTLLPSEQESLSESAQAAAVAATLNLFTSCLPRSWSEHLGFGIVKGITYSNNWIVASNEFSTLVTVKSGDYQVTTSHLDSETSYELTIINKPEWMSGVLSAVVKINGSNEFKVLFFEDHSVTKKTFWLHLPSGSYKVERAAVRVNSANEGVTTSNEILAPLPGKIVKVAVSEGSTVKSGELLFVIDSMKMEHEVRSLRDGVVSEVGCQVGAVVMAGQLLGRVGVG